MLHWLWDFINQVSLTVDYSYSGIEGKEVTIFALCLFLLFDFIRYVLTDFITMLASLRGPARKYVNAIYQQKPLVSVLLPVHNEHLSIVESINSVLSIDYPNLEIIVIDDGSTDGSYEICQEYEQKGLIKLHRNSTRKGKSACLNAALIQATGEFIIAADGDTTYANNIIEHILDPFNDPEVGGVCGNLDVKNAKHNFLTRLQACEYLRTISLGRRFMSFMNILPIVSGAFGCFRKDVLYSVGAWESELGEDLDLSLKILKINMKIKFAPEAIAYTNVPTTLKGLSKQRLRWGKGFFRMMYKKHYSLLNPRKTKFANFFMALDNLFFQVCLPLISIFAPIIYFCLRSIEFLNRESIIYTLVLLLVIVYYMIFSLVSICCAIIITDKPKEHLYLIPLFFFLPFYQFYQRIILIISCLEEILAVNFEDSFFPEEVWASATRW